MPRVRDPSLPPVSIEPLGQDHNLSTGLVFFHAPMCLDDLVKMEDLADLDVEYAGQRSVQPGPQEASV